MRASTLLPALWTAISFFKPVAAMPRLVPRADPTAVWVSVDEKGTPTTTVTPVVTNVDGKETIANGAPYEVTGTVFTTAVFAEKTTSTGTRLPAPTGSGPGGAFARCFKEKGDANPVCDPTPGTELFVGSTYYVTWDPDFFERGLPKGNGTSSLRRIVVHGRKINETTGSIGEQSFESMKFPAAWGFFAWTIKEEMLAKGKPTNVTLELLSSVEGDAWQNTTVGPTVLLTHAPTYHNPPTEVPSGQSLYIALPTVLGFVAIVVIGTCVWNRKKRAIGIGNVMSRTRHGYGIGKSKARRMASGVRKSVFGHKDQGIMLADRDVPEGDRYRDVPVRRDGDGPDRLDISPVDTSFNIQGVSGGRNVFRDEVERQERHKF